GERLGTARSGDDFEAFATQDVIHQPERVGLVVHDQDLRLHEGKLSASGGGAVSLQLRERQNLRLPRPGLVRERLLRAAIWRNRETARLQFDEGAIPSGQGERGACSIRGMTSAAVLPRVPSHTVLTGLYTGGVLAVFVVIASLSFGSLIFGGDLSF